MWPGSSGRHLSLSELVDGQAYGIGNLGAVDYVDLPRSPDDTLACVAFGLYLLRYEDAAVALLVRGPAEEFGREDVQVEVLGDDPGLGQRLLSRLRTLLVERNAFRGQVVALTPSRSGRPGVGPIAFLPRPRPPTRTDVSGCRRPGSGVVVRRAPDPLGRRRDGTLRREE